MAPGPLPVLRRGRRLLGAGRDGPRPRRDRRGGGRRRSRARSSAPRSSEFVPDERERRLVEPRLAHLLGLEQRTGDRPRPTCSAAGGCSSSGWRRRDPVILVFEDLQWADSGLLDFIDYLLEWSAEFPIFILALGRPELRRAGRDWGTTVALEPLRAGRDAGRCSTASLPGCPAELRGRDPASAPRASRCTRSRPCGCCCDRGLLAQEGSATSSRANRSSSRCPRRCRRSIAARLDNLDAAERSLLQDAAVLGMSFSPGALAAVSGRPAATVQRILDRARRQAGARPRRRSRARRARPVPLPPGARCARSPCGTLSRRDAQGASPRRGRVPAARPRERSPRSPRCWPATISTPSRPIPTPPTPTRSATARVRR